MKKQDIEFDHFSDKILDFLAELKSNNNKQWFDEHREFYNIEIKEKSKIFIESMNSAFYDNKLPFIADKKLSLFRINRDIRFSKNKNPYKTNIGFHFPYIKNVSLISKDYPLGLYVHFEPKASFIAVGMYNTTNPHLKIIREHIANNLDEFEDIIKNKDFKKNFPDEMQTSKPLTRVTGYDKDHPAIEYLKKKIHIYSGDYDDMIFSQNNFIDLIIKRANISINYFEFLHNTITN